MRAFGGGTSLLPSNAANGARGRGVKTPLGLQHRTQRRPAACPVPRRDGQPRRAQDPGAAEARRVIGFRDRTPQVLEGFDTISRRVASKNCGIEHTDRNAGDPGRFDALLVQPRKHCVVDPVAPTQMLLIPCRHIRVREGILERNRRLIRKRVKAWWAPADSATRFERTRRPLSSYRFWQLARAERRSCLLWPLS